MSPENGTVFYSPKWPLWALKKKFSIHSVHCGWKYVSLKVARERVPLIIFFLGVFSVFRIAVSKDPGKQWIT